MGLFSKLFLGLCIVCLLSGEAMAALPQSGFVTYSKGDAANRTLYRRRIVNGQMQAEEKICNKGSLGGDIQGVISFDGKWLAFSRSLGAGGGYGGDDYHDFDKWDVYIVSLEGDLPNAPIRVGHGYFPSWGSDSYGSPKTLYWSVRENERAVYKATIDAAGGVSNVQMHYDVPTTQGDLHMQASPDGQKVGYREGSQVYIRHISGPLAGQFIHSNGGCHPSWLADSKWLIHASHRYCRIDGQVKGEVPGSGDYHYGTSQDLQWFITRTDGDWSVQNCGRNCHIMPMSVTESSLTTNPTQRVHVTGSGSWVDVHAGDVVPPDVGIDAFWAEPASITPGASTTLKWTVRNATSITLDGQTVSGDSKTVQPSETTTYTLVAQGRNGPASAEVTVEVTPPVLATIELTPQSARVNLGATLDITAAPKNQIGAPIDADISWSLSGPGSISSTTGATVIYNAPSAETGTATITASSGSVSAEATVTVIDPAAVVTIRYYPREGYADRMVGGVFEGSNGDPHDGPYTVAYTIAETPPVTWNEVEAELGSYRYLRYRAPNGGWGNIAELEFHQGGAKIEGAGFGMTGSYNNLGNTYDKALDGDVTTYFDASRADGAYVGVDAGPGAGQVQDRIDVSAPGSDQVFKTGDELTVRWTASSRITSVRIALLLGGGETLVSITDAASIDRGTGQWGEYTYTLPAEKNGHTIEGTDVTVRVFDYADGTVYGESAPFTIERTQAVPAGGPLTTPASIRPRLTASGNGSVTVEFSRGTAHRVEVYRLNGTRSAYQCGSGQRTYTLPLCAGTHVVRMSDGIETVTRRLVISE